MLDLGELAPGRSAEGNLKAGQRHRYTFRPPAGEGWLVATLSPAETADLTIVLRSSEGEELLTVDEGWTGRAEVLAHGLGNTRAFALDVIAGENTSGRYAFEVEFLEFPERSIRDRARAQQLYHQALQVLDLQNGGELGEADGHRLIRALDEAASLWQGIGEKATAALVYERLARIHEELGEKGSAARCLDRAISYRQQLEHLSMEAADRNFRGLLRRDLGRGEDAKDDFEIAEQIFVEVEHPRHRAASINNLGLLRQDAGDLMGAQEIFEEASRVLAAISSPGPKVDHQAAIILDNRARLEMIQGRFLAAKRLLNQSAARRARAGDPVGLAATRIELGWLEILENRSQQALGIFDQVDESLPNPPMAMAILLNDRRATALEQLGRAEEAWVSYRQAEELARQDRDRDNLAGVLVNLCRLSIRHSAVLGDRPGERCREGLELSRASGYPSRLASALYWRARELERQGHAVEALALYEEAAAWLDALRSRVAGRDGRVYFFEDRSAALRRFIDLSMDLHWSDPKESKNAIRALEASERLRARGVLDLLSEAGIDPFDSAGDEDLAKHRRLSGKLAALDAAQRMADVSTAQLDSLIEVLLDELDQLDQKIRQNSPWFDGLQPIKPLEMKDFQAELDPRTAFLSLLTGESRSHLWIVLRDSVQVFELPGTTTLEDQAARFSKALRLANPYAAWSTGEVLATTLFGPNNERLAALKGMRLVFVGDGQLEQLPLSALPWISSQSARRYLVEEHEVTHLPSLSTLVMLRKLKRPEPSRSVAILADPLYLLDSQDGLDEVDQESLVQLFPDAKERRRLGRLRFTEQEATRVASYFDAASSLVATRVEASRDLALSTELETYTFVHFASHGLLDPKHPGLSALLLSEVDARGHLTDGRLRLQDIYGLSWRAELVVASACETAVGDAFELEGVSGLARGFFHAGVPRTIASLWQVDSESTAHLMDAFYRGFQRDGLSPGAALREARLSLLRPVDEGERAWVSPYFWGAFVLVGDWRTPDIPAPAPKPSSRNLDDR